MPGIGKNRTNGYYQEQFVEIGPVVPLAAGHEDGCIRDVDGKPFTHAISVELGRLTTLDILRRADGTLTVASRDLEELLAEAGVPLPAVEPSAPEAPEVGALALSGAEVLRLERLLRPTTYSDPFEEEGESPLYVRCRGCCLEHGLPPGSQPGDAELLALGHDPDCGWKLLQQPLHKITLGALEVSMAQARERSAWLESALNGKLDPALYTLVEFPGAEVAGKHFRPVALAPTQELRALESTGFALSVAAAVARGWPVRYEMVPHPARFVLEAGA